MSVRIGRQNPVTFDNAGRLALIAGPCLLESRDLGLRVAEALAELRDELGIGIVFKASLDKANRTSVESPRSTMDWHSGLDVLEEIRRQTGLPVLTDVHNTSQAESGYVLDAVQIPAFLCRQTDIIAAAGKTPAAVAIKKGQFLAPGQMAHAAAKVGHDRVLAVERGTSFGYGDLIFDVRALEVMKADGLTVIADVTHAVQTPGTFGHASGGDAEFTPAIARAATAVGIAGIFIEVHPEPEFAMSDAAIQWPLAELRDLVFRLLDVDHAVKS